MKGRTFRLACRLLAAAGTVAFTAIASAQTAGRLLIPPDGLRWGQDSITYTISGPCTGSSVSFLLSSGIVTPPDTLPFINLTDGVPLHELGFGTYPPSAPCTAGTYQLDIPLTIYWYAAYGVGTQGLIPGTYPLHAQVLGPMNWIGGYLLSSTPTVSAVVRFDHPYFIAEAGTGITPIRGSARYISPASSPVAPPPGMASPVMIEVSNAPAVGMTVPFAALDRVIWIYDQQYAQPPQWRALVNGDANYTLLDGHTVIARTFSNPSYIAFSSQFATASTVTPQADMWWGGTSEAGWGLSVGRNGDALFVAGFLYDYNGKPTWGAMQGGSWDATHSIWTADVYSPHGAPFDHYDASKLDNGSPLGKATIQFTSPTSATFQYLGGYKHSIERYQFAPGDNGPYHGYWYGGPTQGGWGLHIAQQADAIFATWYTYGADGMPTWLYMPGAVKISDGHYKGTLYRTTGGSWPTQEHYDSSATHVTTVGILDLAFTSENAGTMTAVVDGKTITNAIQRFGF